MQTAKTELGEDIAGFQAEWNRVFLKKDVVHK